MKVASSIFLSLVSIIVVACADASREVGTAAGESAGGAAVAPLPELDVNQLENILGMKGSQQDGQYKVAVPQSELSVSVDGFRIIPPMGLTSWVAATLQYLCSSVLNLDPGKSPEPLRKRKITNWKRIQRS